MKKEFRYRACEEFRRRDQRKAEAPCDLKGGGAIHRQKTAEAILHVFRKVVKFQAINERRRIGGDKRRHQKVIEEAHVGQETVLSRSESRRKDYKRGKGG